jgi:hypothetical protein
MVFAEIIASKVAKIGISGVIDTAEIRQNKNSVVNVPMKFFTLPSP